MKLPTGSFADGFENSSKFLAIFENTYQLWAIKDLIADFLSFVRNLSDLGVFFKSPSFIQAVWPNPTV